MRTDTLAAAALLAAGSTAHPVIGNQRLSKNLHRRTVDIEQFRLQTAPTYVITEEIPDVVSSIVAVADASVPAYVATAEAVVREVAPNAEYRIVEDYYTGQNGVSHVNFKQTAHGLDIDNADFNVNVGRDGSVFSYGNSFFMGEIPAESPLVKRDFSDPIAALSGASSALDLGVSSEGATVEAQDTPETYAIQGATATNGAPIAKLVYFARPDNTVALNWRVETDLFDDWLLTYVDAENTDQVSGVVNYKADATYQVYPWGINDPTEGSRSIVRDPWNLDSSEFTWQSDGTTTFTTTQGNNGIAQANVDGDSSTGNDFRPDSPTSSFEYEYDPSNPDPTTYQNASVTQLWYTANMYHDVLYQLGFDEAAGNFEQNNNGQGGLLRFGNDGVILNAQDGSGTNNANFATPPDGMAGRMRMYLWDIATPVRDCAFDAGVIIHEYTHGLSNRLTGGGLNTACLTVTESGGMGEGWSDFMALAINTNTTDSRNTDMPIGAWVFDNPAGIRRYPYSTSLTTNPLTYGSVNDLPEVHQIGTVWATMLYEVMWNLIDTRGNSDLTSVEYDSNGVPTDGRWLSMKIVVDGMALQPCNPSFVQARNAILGADENLTGGAYACEIWTAFAKRGLGQNARRGLLQRTEDFTVPAGVC